MPRQRLNLSSPDTVELCLKTFKFTLKEMTPAMYNIGRFLRRCLIELQHKCATAAQNPGFHSTTYAMAPIELCVADDCGLDVCHQHSPTPS